MLSSICFISQSCNLPQSLIHRRWHIDSSKRNSNSIVWNILTQHHFLKYTLPFCFFCLYKSLLVFFFSPWKLIIKEKRKIKCTIFFFHHLFLFGRKLTLSKGKVEILRLQWLANVKLRLFSIDLFIPSLPFPTAINKKWLRLCLAGQVDIFYWTAWGWARKTLHGSSTLLRSFSYFWQW